MNDDGIRGVLLETHRCDVPRPLLVFQSVVGFFVEFSPPLLKLVVVPKVRLRTVFAVEECRSKFAENRHGFSSKHEKVCVVVVRKAIHCEVIPKGFLQVGLDLVLDSYQILEGVSGA